METDPERNDEEVGVVESDREFVKKVYPDVWCEKFPSGAWTIVVPDIMPPEKRALYSKHQHPMLPKWPRDEQTIAFSFTDEDHAW